VAAAERQMQTWARSEELKDHAVHERHVHPAHAIRLYVAITRQAGTEATEIALAVGRELGWEIYDKNLLDLVAERFHEPRLMLDLVDETRSNWVFDMLGTWMDHKIIPHQKFVSHLKRVMVEVGQHGKAIFVGRGAQFLLPRQRVLAVWITASEPYRVERVMRGEGMNEADALQYVRETDAGRQEFVQRFFHHDVNDPLLYDLVINVEQMGAARAVEQILAAIPR
jgi:cytidylate kinase